MASWSDLSNDLLEPITSLLPLQDYHRFGAVCKNWNLVAKQKRFSPAPQLPWLLLEFDATTKKRKFYSLSEKRHYCIDIPELRGQYVCGSSFGWLFTIDKKFKGRLLNPFTREFYDLPLYNPEVELQNSSTTVSSEKTTDDDELSELLEFYPLNIFVSKAILSHDPSKTSDFTALMIKVHGRQLAFWRPGSFAWTKIVHSDCYRIEDIIFFKENFYGIASNYTLYVFDFDMYPKMKLIDNIRLPLFYGVQKYLVDFMGELMIVYRSKVAPDEEYYLISVYNIDLEEMKCSQRKHINDCALFLGGPISCMVVDSKKIIGCEKNAIYFTDMVEYTGKKYGIARMVDERLYCGMNNTISPSAREMYQLFAPPIWITPNLVRIKNLIKTSYVVLSSSYLLGCPSFLLLIFVDLETRIYLLRRCVISVLSFSFGGWFLFL